MVDGRKSQQFPTGDYLLVLVDDYSHFPFMEIVTSLTETAIIPIMDKIFPHQGFPKVGYENPTHFGSLLNNYITTHFG